MAVREEVHRLVDQLSEQDLDAVRRYVETLHAKSDPFRAALEAAPVDDEPVTEDEEAGAAEAREQYRRGETLSLEEVKRFLAS